MIKRESKLIVPSGMPIANIHIESKKVCDKDQIFYNELVAVISRHFIDDRIANPDLKEIYLVRLNILLQHNTFIKLFESQEFA